MALLDGNFRDLIGDRGASVPWTLTSEPRGELDDQARILVPADTQRGTSGDDGAFQVDVAPQPDNTGGYYVLTAGGVWTWRFQALESDLTGNDHWTVGDHIDAFRQRHPDGDPDVRYITPPGIPPGGRTGQVLTKESDADRDAGWETPAHQGIADLDAIAALADDDKLRVLDVSGGTEGSVTAAVVSAYVNAGLPDLDELGGLTKTEIEALIGDTATGTDLPPYLQSTIEVLHSRAGLLYWEQINEVPDTPGEVSAVGHVLTVTGLGDGSFGWRKFTLGAKSVTSGMLADGAVPNRVIGLGAVDEARLNAALRSRLDRIEAEASGGLTSVGTEELEDGAVTLVKLADEVSDELGVDSLARGAISEVQTEHKNLNDRLITVMTDLATVIEVGPPLVRGNTDPVNLSVNIRHPLGAYSAARVMRVGVAGQPAVIVAYDHTILHQDVLAGLTSTALANVWNQTDSIPDGAGGTNTVPRWGVGSYVPVTIELAVGRSTTALFSRTLDLLVVSSVDASGPRLLAATNRNQFAPGDATAVLVTLANDSERFPIVVPVSALGTAATIWVADTFNPANPADNRSAKASIVRAATGVLTITAQGTGTTLASVHAIW